MAEPPILWPPGMKSQLIRKHPDAGKDCGQEEKWTPEDEMVGYHHPLNGHEFEQSPGTVDDRGAWHAAVHWVGGLERVGHNLATEQQTQQYFGYTAMSPDAY